MVYYKLMNSDEEEDGKMYCDAKQLKNSGMEGNRLHQMGWYYHDLSLASETTHSRGSRDRVQHVRDHEVCLFGLGVRLQRC